MISEAKVVFKLVTFCLLSGFEKSVILGKILKSHLKIHIFATN